MPKQNRGRLLESKAGSSKRQRPAALCFTLGPPLRKLSSVSWLISERYGAGVSASFLAKADCRPVLWGSVQLAALSSEPENAFAEERRE
jgi:hypothetical protein